MSTTVLAPSGLEISSSHESAEGMLDALSHKEKDRSPRVLRDKGVEVKPEGDEKDPAAVALGKKGGKAAAEARKTEAKAKPAEEKPDAKDAKPADDKAKGKDPETDPEVEPGKEQEAAADKKGNPRHDPEARVEKLKADIQELSTQKRKLREEIEAESRRAPAAREERTEREPERRAEPARETTGKPKLADYLSKHPGDEAAAIEEYTEAHGKWNREEWQRQSTEESRHKATRDYIARHVDTYVEKITGHKPSDPRAKEAYSQFMSELPDALVSRLRTTFQLEHGEPVLGENIAADRILKASNPREILEHFADNMHEFQRIAALQDPLEIAGEVAILSKRLDAATADTSSEREVSRAGTPPRSVGGSPKTADPDLSNVPFEEHMRRKRAKA
jgi:hypothetical protein